MIAMEKTTLERRAFIQTTLCSMACFCLGDPLHASLSKPLYGAIKSFNNTASHDRVFTLQLQLEYVKLYKNNLRWLKFLVERLGYENALHVWNDTYQNYDDRKLISFLSSGWTHNDNSGSQNPDDIIRDFTDTYFRSPIEGLIKDEAKHIVEATPPINQIRNNCMTLNLTKDVTTYDFFHLSYDGAALLVETLIKRFKKQGEFIAYDFIREGRVKGAEKNPLSAEQLISAIGSITKSERPDLMTAALQVDLMHSSSKEIVMHVKECEWARYFQKNHPDIGYLMACSTDEAAYTTANKDIRMQRTNTIMEGGNVCDFRVYAVT
jgi:hypothetical protein